MPWIYKLKLTAYRDAETVQDDWVEKIPGSAPVKHANGGVQVTGTDACIVSDRKNPDYEAMTELGYVESITEDRETPSDKVYHLATDESLPPAEADPL